MARTASAARTVEFRCPQCKQYHLVEAADAGRRASCRACGAPFEVPQKSDKITRVERWAATRGEHLVAAETIGANNLAGWQRGFKLLKQSVALALSYRASLIPTAIALVLCIGVALAAFFGLGGSDREIDAVTLFIVLLPQYVIFYFCMGMTIRMVFGYLVGERVTVGQAFAAALTRLPNILLLAAIGTIFDVAIKLLRRNRGLIAKLIASALEAFWTTASFLIMPGIMIDDLSFTDAVKRGKDAVTRNLVPIGVGEVAVRLVTNAIAIAGLVVLFGVFQLVHAVLPGLPMFLPFLLCLIAFVVLVGVLSVYTRTVYYTSLYVWTVAKQEAEQVGGRVYVPAPLAVALGSA